MTKVYIVNKMDFDTGYSIFCQVFFKRALAEDWINGRRDPTTDQGNLSAIKRKGFKIEIF